MKHLKNIGISLMTVAVVALGSSAYAHCGACGSDSHAAKAESKPTASKETVMMKKNIVETAIAAGEFTTLVDAVKAAGLVETLSGDGPFTVFAPTNAAFAKLPEGTIDALLKDKERLGSILTYHVLASNVSAADVVKLTSAQTVNGQSVTISANGKGVMVDDAKVVTTDILCSNGIIHVIDAVILPKDKDLIETANEAGSFKTLLAALEAADLTHALRGKGPFTIFAPTDDAFAKLPDDALKSLLADKDRLSAVLTYHVIPGLVRSSDVAEMQAARTLQGSEISISTNDAVQINNATVVMADVGASNGVIHVIDEVLLPN